MKKIWYYRLMLRQFRRRQLFSCLPLSGTDLIWTHISRESACALQLFVPTPPLARPADQFRTAMCDDGQKNS